MITLKKPEEIDCMKRAGRVVADVHNAMRDMIRPGIDTMSLSDEADRILDRESAGASFRGYKVHGIRTLFPSAICVSINEEVVHGIPSRERILEEGDIVSIDVGAIVKGYHGDAACTYPVGKITPERAELLSVTEESLSRAISAAILGNTVGDIGYAVESYVLSKGYGLVRDYAGHGVGYKLHESPQVPNFGKPQRGVVLKAGMTLAIEPMVMAGKEETLLGENHWVLYTADGSDAAHFERSIAVTADGPEILTPWKS
jgi:methionyl aminopeptidase